MTKRFAIAAVIVTLNLAGTASAAPVDVNQVLDDFVAATQASEAVPAEQKNAVAEVVAQLRSVPEDRSFAVTESLRLLHPEYKDALNALGEENLGAAIVSLTKQRDSADPFLAADSSYYLARAYLLDERFEEVVPLLSDLQNKWADKTALGGEVLFLRGVAEVALLRHKEAQVTLDQFLSQYPDAPERMRVGAFRQLEQLKLFAEGTLSDVQLRMDFSRRKLTLEDTGAETRTQQDKIVELLAKLIKDAEERECNCKGGGSGSGKKQGKPGEAEGQAQGEGQGGQSGNSGGGSKGTDSDTVKRLHRGGPQSPWSHLRDKDRDPVYSAIKDKFPARYEQLIEQYYKSFQDDSEG